MKLPIRKRKREQMLAQLRANGFNVKEGEGRELVIEDSHGNKTRLIFDEKYVPQKIVKPSGLEYTFTFDADEHLTKFGFPGNEFIGFDYQDDLLKAILLNEGRIGLNYDDKGRITEVISQDDKSYKISYNVSAQVESITNRANETRHFDSVVKDNHLVHSMKDSLGRVTQVKTDHVGDSGDKITFPDGTEQSSVYDENLDALVTTLRSGAKVLTYYEGTNPNRVEWEDGNFLNLELEGEQVKSLENPAGTVRFEYDDKGRVLSEDFQGNQVRYTYDKDGNLLEMTYPSGMVARYDYDVDGRLQGIKVGDHACTYKYGENDTVAEVHYPNGLVQKRTEKVLGGLQGATITNGAGAVLSQQTYQYDNLYRLTRYNNTGEQSPGRDWQFRYDDEWRLLTSFEANSQRLEKFEYDQKGNFSSVNGTAVAVGSMDEVLVIGGNTVQYDGNGNVRSFVNSQGRTVSLTFNDNNELKIARIGDETWEYWYDGLGRRVGKSNGRDAYKFCWGSEKLLAEEVRTTEGTTVREYIYGANATVPVAFRENGKLFWLHSDVRGAVTQVFDSFGQVVWSAEYTAFGEAIPHQGGIRQPWRLTGQYHDAETGLHYNKARYYSPHLKSFLSLDKQWSHPFATNYNYAANDPFNKVDVNGDLLGFLGIAAAVGASVVAGVAVAAAAVVAAAVVTTAVVATAVVATAVVATAVVATAVVAAVATVAAVVATAVAVTGALGAIGGAVGAVVSSVVDNVLNGEGICIPCAIKAAILGAISGGEKGLKVVPRAIAELVKNTMKPDESDETREFGKLDGKFISCGNPQVGSDTPPAGKRPQGCTGSNLPKVVFVNGIDNKPDDNCESAQNLANTLCAEVVSFYNATDGMATDLAECVQNISNEDNVPARNLEKFLRENEGSDITLVAHSQGGLVTRQALTRHQGQLRNENSSDEVKAKMSKIKVISAGTAEDGWPEGPSYEQYTNTHDKVPKVIKVADAIYDVPGKNDTADRTVFMNKESDGFMGHNMNKVYIPEIQKKHAGERPSHACSACKK